MRQKYGASQPAGYVSTTGGYDSAESVGEMSQSPISAGLVDEEKQFYG